MKVSKFASLLALWGISYVFSQETEAPLLSPDALEDLIDRSALLAHAEQFLAFSKLSNGTRAFGSKGHQATLQYVKDLLEETGYYDVELEEFVYSYSEAKAWFFADGKEYLTKGLGYSPSGDITGSVVVVND